ncbi:DUF6221 family protein [Arthrobacter sp. D1-17]
MDIVEFLSVRIAEDEAAARRLLRDQTLSKSAQWYEERLLLECAAKRRIIGIVENARQTALAAFVSNPYAEGTQWIPEALEWTTLSLNALALPYSDHPEFEPHWLSEGRDRDGS